MKINEIETFLDEIFSYNIFNETSSTNGLQVQGKENVNKIAFAVDATAVTVQKCVDAGADALMVHHGLFWPSIKSVKGANYNVFKKLIQNEISLFAMHLPLDLHEQIGNSVGIIELLGGDVVFKGDYSYIGEFNKVEDLNRVKSILDSKLDTNSKLFDFSNGKVKRFGVCSGAGAPEIYSLAKEGIELFITGELKHSIYDFARESSISLIGSGHYATETVGIKLLQKEFDKLGIDTVYIEDKIDI